MDSNECPHWHVQDWLELQASLQQNSFHLVPSQLRGDDRADFALWNAYALIDEISEAMQELKWKPWLTTGRGAWVNRDHWVDELVDAMHFLANLLLIAGVSGAELRERYERKNATNARRQAEGYDGTKDADGREIDRALPSRSNDHIAQRFDRTM